jgi:hypothetical protein
VTIARALTLAATLPLLSSCVDNAHFNVKKAPELRPMTVSVLGVFKEGRLSPETWDDLGAKISPVFQKAMCPIGYDTKLPTDQPDLAEAIDDYSRANGVTDDLLAELSPAANGDAILVVSVAGRPLKQKNETQMAPPTGMQNAPGPVRGRGGGGLPPPTSMSRVAFDQNAYEMSATLFSLKDRHTIAEVSMGYGGESADEAIAKFVEKLRSVFTGYPCVGWHMNAGVDQKRIRAMKE